MALASRQFWSNKKNFKSNTSSFKPKGQRIRTFFSCGNVSYFVADCPYEKREDHGGKIIRKDKSKSPLNKNFVKKNPQRVLVAQEEYFSDDEDDEEGGELWQPPPLPSPSSLPHHLRSSTPPTRTLTSSTTASWLRAPR